MKRSSKARPVQLFAVIGMDMNDGFGEEILYRYMSVNMNDLVGWEKIGKFRIGKVEIKEVNAKPQKKAT